MSQPDPAARHRRPPPAQAGDGFVYPRYVYRTPAELASAAPGRHPIVIVGAGLVGLTLAADLGSRGVPCVVLDDNDTVSNGSRAIGQARKSLQVWDRCGAAGPMARKGLSWNYVRYLHGDRVVADHALYPEPGHKFPPMMVLPQYYIESFLVERCAAFDGVDIRWKNAVCAVVPADDHVQIEVDTPDGRYALQAEWVVAADGVGSTVRRSLGLPFQGTKVEDRFVIVDVKVADDFPPGRSFWFKQNFHEGNSTLFLRQPDDVCRIDFNIGPDADAEVELSPARVLAKLQAMFGPGKDFDIKWVSLYTVEVRRLQNFREGRVFFIGDAAHQISPFSGGRGGNSGVEDADNLGWKLQRVIEGGSPPALLDTYDAERIPIADQNIRYSLRASEFISPSFAASAVFQEATLTLAARLPFAHALINSGRFSTPAPYEGSPLNSADDEAAGFAAARVAPGCAAVDAPVLVAGIIRSLVEMLGRDFCLMVFGLSPQAVAALREGADRARLPLRLLFIEDIDGARVSLRGGESSCVDAEGLVRERYGLAPHGAYLFRPDQRVAGRWREPDPTTVGLALAKACALAPAAAAA